jgi:P-type E1-E2 ATPase
MAGIGNATKYGILVREGDALERISKVASIAFDKTGTLTYGKPSVIAVESYNQNISSEKLLTLTASAELYSEHPLGKAIIAHYKAIYNILPKEPKTFKMLAGQGVKAVVDNCNILAGNAEMLFQNSIELSKIMLKKAEEYKNDGCTIIYIAEENQAIGFIALSDTLRTDAIKMIEEIKKIGVESILVTGDNLQAASHISKAVGITSIHNNCLPEDKLSIIAEYENIGKRICMVGDGVNDAPALKKAYVSIAMGGIGSDIAVDAADIVFVSDDIKCIPHLLSLSQRTMRIIKLNLILSMLLNFIAIILAMTGVLNPVLGALVHNIGSVVVIINSSLLLNWKK